MSSADVGSSSVNESLRLNSRDLAIGDSGNDLMRPGVLSSGVGGYVMVEVDSGDSENDGSMMMIVDVSLSVDRGSLILTSY